MPPEVSTNTPEPRDPRVLDLSDIADDPLGGERATPDGDRQRAPADTRTNGVIDDSDGPDQKTIDRATEMGWAPQDKWRGPAEAWIDATEFVKRGDFMLPILRKERDELREKTRTLETEISTLKQSTGEVLKWQREQAAARALREKATLVADRKEALEAGDMDRVNEIDIQMAENRDKERDKPREGIPPERAESVRVFKEFAADNPWVNSDVELQEAMTIESTNLRNAGTQKNGRAFLDAVADRVKRMYPEKFRTNGRRTSMTETDASHVDTSQGGGVRSFSNLKSDRQALARKWEQQGVLTIKEYLAQCEPSDFRS